MKCHPTKHVQDLREEDPPGTTNCPDDPAGDEFPEAPDTEEPSERDDADDDRWDAFLADDDELDPTPEPGDFWPEDD